MGESITDGTLATLLKSMRLMNFLLITLAIHHFIYDWLNGILCSAEPGDRVEADEAIAQIETDKVSSKIRNEINT